MNNRHTEVAMIVGDKISDELVEINKQFRNLERGRFANAIVVKDERVELLIGLESILPLSSANIAATRSSWICSIKRPIVLGAVMVHLMKRSCSRSTRYTK